MPEFEEIDIRSLSASAKSDSTESKPSRHSDRSSTLTPVPMAPHRGQAIEYSPRRSRSSKPAKDSTGGSSARSGRVQRTSRSTGRRGINSAYTKRSLPASIANLPKPSRGLSLFGRIKEFFSALFEPEVEDKPPDRSRYGSKRRRRPRDTRRRQPWKSAKGGDTQPRKRQSGGQRKNTPQKRKRARKHQNYKEGQSPGPRKGSGSTRSSEGQSSRDKRPNRRRRYRKSRTDNSPR